MHSADFRYYELRQAKKDMKCKIEVFQTQISLSSCLPDKVNANDYLLHKIMLRLDQNCWTWKGGDEKREFLQENSCRRKY